MVDDNLEKYLFHITVKDYKNLLKNILEELLPPIIKKELSDFNNDLTKGLNAEKETLSVAEASVLTGLRPKSIYTKVSRLEMPSLTRGRPLMFSRTELVLWMRNGKPTVSQIMYDKYKNGKNT